MLDTIFLATVFVVVVLVLAVAIHDKLTTKFDGKDDE